MSEFQLQGIGRDEGGGEIEIAGNFKRENAVPLQNSAIIRRPVPGKYYVTRVPSPKLGKLRIQLHPPASQEFSQLLGATRRWMPGETVLTGTMISTNSRENACGSKHRREKDLSPGHGGTQENFPDEV